MNAPTSPASDLRPLAIGELVDRSASFWRQNFGTLFRLYFVFEIVAFILAKGFEVVLSRFSPLVRGGAKLLEAMQNDAPAVMRQYVVMLAATTVFLLSSVLLSWIFAVIGSRYVIRKRLGQPASLADGITRVRQRFGVLFGAYVLSNLWTLGVGIVSLIPGVVLIGVASFSAATGHSTMSMLLAGFGVIVAGLGVLITALWYVLRFLLTAQVVAMEDVGAWGALKRSGKLVSGRIGKGFLDIVKVRATVLLTLVFAILLVVGIVAGVPAMIVQFAYGHPFDPAGSDPDAVPQLLLIPAQLLQVGAEAVISPLYLVFGALFYVDMRVRREGLDLELKLEATSTAEAA